jgi:hypothetical protein
MSLIIFLYFYGITFVNFNNIFSFLFLELEARWAIKSMV